MMQRWSEDTIRFMEDASLFGNYHKELAEILLPYLPTEGHICDAGCGLGHLALALSEYCHRVTAVDASADALKGLLSAKIPSNMKVCRGDVFAMDEQYDGMVFCYFGKTEEILQLSERRQGCRFLVVRRDCSVHRFSTGTVYRKHHSIDYLKKALETRKIPYITKEISLELGQPFRSMTDAVNFFRLYNKSEEPVRPDTVAVKLVATDNPQFPFYYPNVREMELIVFDSPNFTL